MYKSVIHSLIVLSLSRRQNTLSVQYSLNIAWRESVWKPTANSAYIETSVFTIGLCQLERRVSQKKDLQTIIMPSGQTVILKKV